ncbi:ATPase [Pyrolobus fumarii 1A]|uniref:ATPase n=1 Tax=Pyrolobus fumarii (strain DSM 11204 / 1A) TaxID=694429 RepID=G0EFK1_PYRF1|nr:ATPase [Pyrolobus fumarii 1A]
MRVVVERPWLSRFLLSGGRRLLYGRRKTGKTFYARRVLREYQFFIVRRGGAIYDPVNDETLDVAGFLRLCRLGERIILDEFHRADPRIFDAVQAGVCSEELVFITSTLHYYRRFVEEPEAPLKGLFAVRRVGLLTPLELLNTGWGGLEEEPARLIEHLVFYQEPVLIGRSLGDIVASGMEYARSLLGEVLTEEDHRYTARFDAILEAIAAGRTRLTEISSYLYLRGLIEKDSPSHVTKYLDVMVRVGLLERLEVWGRRRGSIYRHYSPLTDLAYHLQARYDFYEVPAPLEYGVRAARQRLPLLVEVFAERLLAQLYGLKPVKILEPEVDIALVRFKRLELVAEVKWVSRLSRDEVRRVEEKLYRLEAEKRILIVPDESIVPETSLEVWDAKRMIKEARAAKSILENL